MAGLGTGLAPFRAFVQHRAWEKAQGKEIGQYSFTWDHDINVKSTVTARNGRPTKTLELSPSWAVRSHVTSLKIYIKTGWGDDERHHSSLY
jgi:hypothetical protein